MKMELPPGWRGYGAKDHIDHPDTAKRIAEIEALKQARDGADRFTVQGKLMPYEHLMPKTLRGRNERLGEMLRSERAYMIESTLFRSLNSESRTGHPLKGLNLAF